MASVVVIENDPRVLRQIKQYMGELSEEEHKVRYFDDQEQFEARYFNKANQKESKSPLQELPSLNDWTSVHVEWLLERKLETNKPFEQEKLSLELHVPTAKINSIHPDLPPETPLLGVAVGGIKAAPNSFEKLIGTPFQPIFKDMIQKAAEGQSQAKTFPMASGDTGQFWLIHVQTQSNNETVTLNIENHTESVRNIFNEEVAKRSHQESEDGVELDLLAHIDLILFKLSQIKDFKKGWLKETAKKIENFGFRPPLRATKFIMLKYEDDGHQKVDLLYPQLNDLIYLPLDRVLFLQKVDIILSQPELIQPRFLFEQETEMQVNLSKRTVIEHISDIGFGIRNPMALTPGLLGHFFFTFPGEELEYEVYGKVQASIPHPELQRQFIVYFSFVAIPKTTLTEVRKYLSQNPRYQSLKSEDKNEFIYNPDNIFLTEDEKRVKNVVLVIPDALTLQQTSKTINNNFDQMRVMGVGSYQEFLKNNFSSEKRQDAERKVDLATVKPTTDDDLGPSGNVLFFVNRESLAIEAPMPPESETDSVLGHRAQKLLDHNNEWVSLLFPMKSEQEVLEEAVDSAAKGRQIKKTFVVFDGSMETRLVHFHLEKSNADESIKIEITPANAQTLKEKILLEAPIGTLDALVIDSHFVPEDINSWVEGLTQLCKDHHMLPSDRQLKIIVISSDDVPLSPKSYQHKNIRAALMAPFDTRSLLLNISLATNNKYSIYNFDNLSWLDARMPVHIAKPMTLLSISEFGGTVASNTQIANGTFLFLRGSIYDQAPRKNLCARFYATEPIDDGPFKYKCHLLYFGINESFMKFARNWFRETYAASKQKDG